ncbi:HD domain-containing protein [Kosmotoga pacifica]|uniref:HD domain-containing protein n=1 Tax=Kosmotoga pacifica TaxID=1330330 RepID=A0A0G2Z6T8_9BACT|nr:HD domain-containing protein [Kosmotoga pacifica]AKI97277.1 hypothetical protein IX53_04990 [Kosmotoga pacifica]
MGYIGYIERAKRRFPEISDIANIVEAEMLRYPSASHDILHVERVLGLGWKIYETENVGELKVLTLAILLHDAKRHEEETSGVDHAFASAQFAKHLLSEKGFSETVIEIVYDSILSHRYANRRVPKFVEGKILQDADRLDSIGAIAIARLFNHNNELRRPLFDPRIKPKKQYDGVSETYLNHFFEKILKMTPNSFWMETSRKIAEGRYEFTLNFVRKFIKEWYVME